MGSEQIEWSRVFESLEDSGLKVLHEERYSIVKEVGRGGAKIVYRAVDNNSGREVAYVTPISNDEEKMALFLREARITAYLQHPNILPVYDVSGETEAFFVCKLLRGKTLSKIRPKAYSQGELIAYFRKICEAVEYAHSRGVLHLDLKPDNIRLDKYGELLLFDWGLAEIFCTESIESPLDNPLISGSESAARDYTSLGTPGYMSPEQIEGKKVDVKTDIFSLGALLYFIFHRKAPFKGRSIDDVFDNTVLGRRQKIKSDLSTSLTSIIDKCLSINPKDRYMQVGDLIADLDALEKNYVPVAENANFIKHISLLYKRNKLICNVLVLFIALFAVFNIKYIKELNASKSEAVLAKVNAERYLQEVLEEQKKNGQLTKALSPRYYLEALGHWKYYRLPESMKNCEFALKLDPKNKKALELKAQLLFINERYDEAAKIWSRLNGVNAYKKLVKEIKGFDDPDIDQVIKKSRGNLKLREMHLRILLNAYRSTGNMDYLTRLIKVENTKVENLNISFRGGVLNLENNQELENINFTGGLSFSSLILRNTGVDDLSALKGRKFKMLDISNSEVWEFFTLEGASIERLILGVPKATSLWALARVKLTELEVSKPKDGRFPNQILQNLQKLSIFDSGSVNLTLAKRSNLKELDLRGSWLNNPQILLKLSQLKNLTVDQGILEQELIQELEAKGVRIAQSSSSLNR